MRTYGYDYAFALSVDEVNRILTDNLKNINLELKYAGKDEESGSTITLDCKTAPWQIVKGGQNSLLRFSMPLTSGTLSIKGPISKSYTLGNITVLIEVTLGWLGAGSQQSAGSGNITELVFSPTKTKDPDNPGYVAVVNILDPDKHLDTVGTALIRKYIVDILFENKDKINFIFANVFPKPNKVASWLTPYKWVYYYSSGQSFDALCFLCMISDKPWPSNPAFDSTALKAGSNASILIAQEVFFRKIVLPSVTGTFSGGFSVNVHPDETCAITNNGDFNVNTGKATITASKFSLATTDSGNGLKTYTSGGGPLKFFFGLGDLPNASYSWSCQNTNPLQYANEQVHFLRDNNPVMHHDQDIPWYDWVLLVVLGITSLPGLISVIVDSVNNFSDKVNDIGISNINSNLERAVNGSVVNLANLVNWSEKNGQSFKANNSGLDGALFVHGNLN